MSRISLRWPYGVLALGLAIGTPLPVWACATCGCTLSFGLCYQVNPKWVPQLQVNPSHKDGDQGALADVPDTPGTVAYLSPGMTIEVVLSLHLYGFVQVPIYSNLDGYQLFPHWTAAVGANYAL